MKALFTVREKIPAIRCEDMVRCGSRPAGCGFGPNSKGKARRLLVANVVNKTNNYQITTDTSQKDRNIYNIFESPCPIPERRTPVSFTAFLPSLDATLWWRVALCCAVLWVGATTEHSSIMCFVGVYS